tara:strand:- start:240 stop:917 length:678 start_codon:yes stop_codon:yes gene_type:complete
MENFNEELKQLSNLSDEYINPIIDKYFKNLDFENILCHSEEATLDYSKYADYLRNDIYPYLKKFEPVSLSYLEQKIYDVICQELAIEIVIRDSCYGYFDDTHLIEGHEEFGTQIFNLFQKICGKKIKEYFFEVTFQVEYNRLYMENFRVDVKDYKELDETDVLYEIKNVLFEIKKKLEARLRKTLRADVSFKDWEVLFSNHGDFYYEEEDDFKNHLKRLELIAKN